METVVEEEAPQVKAEEPVEQRAVAVTAQQPKMFQNSAWVHVGEGAADCEHVAANPKQQGKDCDDEEHFHAYCRLPNQFQHRDVVEKATAAKARRIRLLRDDSSDAYEVLEGTLRAIRDTEDPKIVIEELLTYTWQEDYLEAIREVEEDERFERVDQDREELTRLLELPEAERGEDEVEKLEEHIGAYVQATKDKVAEVQAPRRQALESLSFDEQVAQLRERRIEADSDEEYHHVFSQWEWFVGTKQPDRRTDKWTKISEMTKDASPEVIDELRGTFTLLRMALQRGGRGN